MLNKKQCIVLLFMICGLVLYISYESPSVALAQIETQVSVPEKINSTPSVAQHPKGKYDYLEITQSCGPDFEGHCIYAYSGPGVEYKKVYELRRGILLKIKSKEERNGQTWYRVYFDEKLRYKERVEGDWYIPAVAGHIISDDGEQLLTPSTPSTSKRIVVVLSDHMIYAYDGDVLFLSTKVSTGIKSAPTPIGTFTIYKKTPSRYMQGPIEGVTDVPFDLPGVSWNMYFTKDGAVIHGAYWHNRYGTDQSDGCINLPPEISKILYDWAPLKTVVTIKN